MRVLAVWWLVFLGWLAPEVAEAAESDAASGTTGLVWQWGPDQERRYLMQANVRFPRVFFTPALNNRDLRVVEMYTAMFVTCRNSEKKAAKRIAYLECKVDDVQLKGAPPPQDANRGLKDSLDEWDALIREATIQLEFGTNGKLRTLDVEDMPNRINRYRQVEQQIRLLLVRVFTGLELELPRRGEDRGSAWTQRDSYALQLPSQVGSFGSAKLQVGVAGVEGTVATIRREGRGTIKSGETVQATGAQGERNADIFDAALQGTATFDLATGTLLTHDYGTIAEPTASSELAQGVGGTLYIQRLHVEAIPAGASVAPLDDNAETVPGQNGI